MNKKTSILRSAVLITGTLLLIPTVCWLFAPQRFKDDLCRFDEGPGSFSIPRLSWLLSDKTKMWRVVRIHSGGESGKQELFVSPTSAIRAAHRILTNGDFKGLTWDEFKATVQWDSDYDKRSYTGPFFQPSDTCYLLRFDNGNFGNQYEIYFDPTKRIAKIMELPIH